MAQYTAKDFVTVVDEDGHETEVPKAWLGTSLLGEGVKKAEAPRRRSSAKDEAAEALEAAEKARADAVAAAAASAKEAEELRAKVADLEAKAASSGSGRPAAKPSEQK